MRAKRFKFKSISPYYEKEREGIKPNTAREIDLSDQRFIDLIYYNEAGYNPGDIEIEIVDITMGSKNNDYFVRDINDISIWGNIMIISWVHKALKIRCGGQE